MSRRISAVRRVLTTNMALVTLGYSLYHGVTLSAYLTDFALTPVSFGYISNTCFMTSVTPTVILTALGLYLWAHIRKPASFSLDFRIPLLGLAAGYICALLLQGKVDNSSLMYLLGAIWGLSATLGEPSWIELIVHSESNLVIILQLAICTFIAALVSVFLKMLPTLPSMVICLILIALCYPLMVRCRHRAAPFTVDPSEHAVRATLRDALPLLLAYFFFELICGMVNMFAYKVPSAFQIATSAPVLSMLVCGILLVVIVVVTARTPNPSLVYLVILPAVIGIFLLLPFFGGEHGRFLSTVIYSAHMITSLLAFYRYLSSTREHGADIYRVAALVILFARLFLYAGIMMGYTFGTMSGGEDFVHLSIVVVVCIYCLGLAIIIWALRTRHEARTSVATSAITHEQAVRYRADELAEGFGLTNRERDVLVELSKGNSAARIAENLCLSISTVQGYIKNIYAKLGVNRKQQVLDLFTTEEIEKSR